MPAPTKIYFSQIAVGWEDWVQVVNVSNETANVIAVARNANGQTVWSQDARLRPYQAWTVSADTVNVAATLVISSDKPIVGERHCHSKTEVLNFPGASPEGMTVGRRLFFPEIYTGGSDWFQIMNVGEQPANINAIVRHKNGRIHRQFGKQKLPSLGWWNFTDREMGNITGTIELMCTQPCVGERHLHYTKGHLGSAVGQLGQVLDKPTTRLFFPELSEVWNDWVQIVNVSNEKAKVNAVARDQSGKTVWSQEATLNPFHAWNPSVESIKGNTSVTVTSDKHIVGERHDHRETQVLNFPGASLEMRTAGRRLFFPETYAGGLDWFRFMNVGDAGCRVSIISRDREGNVKNQLNSPNIPSMGYWIVTDKEIRNVTGTLEAMCTQPTVGERHLHYDANVHKGVAVGQFGQVID
ncbi:hypothetical protein GF312_09020 [Candidatus Poribacteria bacterium]|nr:hypothetical protein [Candidatus Poribacteria bacterium]